MVLRRDDRGVLAIGQPSHAWISGQLARNWGNAQFGRFEPWEDVCLAAEQHDVGMASWDLTPSYNEATGLPYGFTEMPLAVHLELWRGAAPRLVRQNRYAAMLVARHGARLYELRDLERMAPADADAVRAVLRELAEFQSAIGSSMPAAPRADFALHSDLLWTWDYVSLALCLGWPPCTAKRVPAADGPLDLELTAGPEPHQVRLAPWPFAADTLSVRCEGQRLRERYAGASELRAALAAAPWETLAIELAPARSA
jgi:Protein of unknown function (DUF3891)